MNNVKIFSQRNIEKYTWDGYIYNKADTNKERSIQFWRCEKKTKGCRGRVWTNVKDGSFHSLRSEHNCSKTGNEASIIAQKIRTAVKHYAAATMENSTQIRAKVLDKVPNAVEGIMANRDAMRKTIKRHRKKIFGAPAPSSECCLNISIPEDYSRYAYTQGNLEEFLLADSGKDRETSRRILIFGRNHHSTWCPTIKELFVDSTFLISPPLFSQIVVILARKDGRRVFPVLYCLLSDQKAQTYKELFQMIKKLWPSLNPQNINVDFEPKVHEAIRAEFPQATVNGCFFHLIRHLKKHLDSCNLLEKYNDDTEFALNATMIASVAFVPEDDIIYAVTVLENFLSEEFEPIFGWVTNSFTGRIRNNGTRAPPMFSPNVWSLYQRMLDQTDKTNYFEEACHRRLEISFGDSTAHQTLWTFIEKLKKIQKFYDVEYETDDEPLRNRTRFEVADSIILKNVRNYDRDNVLEYLCDISYNYNIN